MMAKMFHNAEFTMLQSHLWPGMSIISVFYVFLDLQCLQRSLMEVGIAQMAFTDIKKIYEHEQGEFCLVLPILGPGIEHI